MIKTKIKKGLATLALTSFFLATIASTYAATQIGTGSVNGDSSFDTAVIWDDNLPGSAVASVEGIKVTAQVLPTLNMTISTGLIDLGILIADTETTGTLDIEVSTNAADGVVITAKSGSGGLTNTTDNALQINNSTADGVVDSYKYSSVANTDDSTITGFIAGTGNLPAIEIINNSDEHIIYSTNKPEQDDATDADLTFSVSATSNAQTAAGNYEDTITFTISGNF